MDRTTKVILALIAAGLWLNAGAALVRPAVAQDGLAISSVARDIHAVVEGSCPNGKLC